MFKRKTKGKKSRLKDWLIVIALFLAAGIIIRNGSNSNTQNSKHLAKTETSVVTLAPTKEPIKEKQNNNVSEEKDNYIICFEK